MGILDQIFQRAPGVIGQGLRGQNEGVKTRDDMDARARQQAIAQKQLERQIERDAMEMSIRQQAERRQQDLAPVIADLRRAQEEQARARAGLTGAQTVTEAERPGLVRAQTGRTQAQTVTEGERPDLIAAQTALALARAAQARSAADGQGHSKPLPASAITNIAAYKNILAAAEDAQGSLAESVGAGLNTTGPIKGRMSSLTQAFPSVFGKTDNRVISAQAKLSNVTSEIMKQRSGGAVTDAEFERLKPFLASRNDDETAAAQKLADLIAYLNRSKETLETGFREQGYNVGGGPQPAAPGVEDRKARAARLLAEQRAGKPQE